MSSANSTMFEVRIKNDRKVYSRHYQAKDQDQASEIARKRNKGRVIGVRKVQAWDIIGTIESMKLDGIVSKGMDFKKTNKNVIFNETTVDSILFGNNK